MGQLIAKGHEIFTEDGGGVAECSNDVRAAQLVSRFNAFEPGGLVAEMAEVVAGLLAQEEGPAQVFGNGCGNDGTKTGLSGEEFNALRDSRLKAARAVLAKYKGEGVR